MYQYIPDKYHLFCHLRWASDSNINAWHLPLIVYPALKIQLGQNRRISFFSRTWYLFSPILVKSMTIYQNVLYFYLLFVPILKSWANLDGFTSNMSKIISKSLQSSISPLCCHYLAQYTTKVYKYTNYTSYFQFSSSPITLQSAENANKIATHPYLKF